MPRREPKALNRAICLGDVWPSLGGKGTVVVFSPSSEDWRASSTDDWISGFTSEHVPGYSSFTFEIAKNRGSARTGSIRVTGPDARDQQVAIHQRGGSLVVQETALTLDPSPPAPRASFPLIMELGIAGKYLAQQIRQAPPEGWPPLIAAVDLLIETLEAAAIATRVVFDTVPDPPDYFSADPLPMTPRLILLQGTLLQAYLTEQVAEG